jgi:hypothetical protein
VQKEKAELELLLSWTWAFSFLFGGDGRATVLINYETSLLPKTKGGNVIGFSCYHLANYDTLSNIQKKELAQKDKKLLNVTESVF